MTDHQQTDQQTDQQTSQQTSQTIEATDTLDVLHKHRGLFRSAVEGLTDDQARLTPTVSELSLGGLVKHVTAVERQWADFVVSGAPDLDFENVDWSNPPEWVLARQQEFVLADDETLEGVLAAYAETAAATDALVASVDPDQAHALPKAPWFEPGATWTNRRVFVHLVAETAQHAGHADIIREAIDGRKSMG